MLGKMYTREADAYVEYLETQASVGITNIFGSSIDHPGFHKPLRSIFEDSIDVKRSGDAFSFPCPLDGSETSLADCAECSIALSCDIYASMLSEDID